MASNLINEHFAVKGRDGVLRESALISHAFQYFTDLYFEGILTPRQLEGYVKRLMAVKTPKSFEALVNKVKATEAEVRDGLRVMRERLSTKKNPRRRRTTTRRR